jgi:hypothetical protein
MGDAASLPPGPARAKLHWADERSSSLYVVAWSGGYEQPQFAVRFDREEARLLGESWADDAKDGDQIDVLKIDLHDEMTGGPTIVRIFDLTMGEEFPV